MTKKNCAGFIFSNALPYLDHLATLCSLLNMPLILTDKPIFKLAKKFYPEVNTILHENYCNIYSYLKENFKIIFSCHLLRADPSSSILLNLYFQKMTTIWLSHGHSDKGTDDNMFQALKDETFILMYGKKMVDILKKQGVYDKIKKKVLIGNYRYSYFLKYKKRSENLLKEEITKKLDPNLKTIFFAPTWHSKEKKTTLSKAITSNSLCKTDTLYFSKLFYSLIENLPKNYNLIIKPHPNTFLQMKFELDRIIWNFRNKKNILFLKNFPSIYPILDFSDIYIGDNSSIGYDFLTFNKPMFFINKKNKEAKTDPSLYLFRCGNEIFPNQFSAIYNIIEKKIKKDKESFSDIRKKVYEYSFSKDSNFKKIKEEIQKNCQQCFVRKTSN